MGKNSEPTEIDVEEVRVETGLALLCIIDGDEHWIPKSLIDKTESTVKEKGDSGKVVIPQWLAEEKGLV